MQFSESHAHAYARLLQENHVFVDGSMIRDPQKMSVDWRTTYASIKIQRFQKLSSTIWEEVKHAIKYSKESLPNFALLSQASDADLKNCINFAIGFNYSCANSLIEFATINSKILTFILNDSQYLQALLANVRKYSNTPIMTSQVIRL